jgi:hypothetical protein
VSEFPSENNLSYHSLLSVSRYMLTSVVGNKIGAQANNSHHHQQPQLVRAFPLGSILQDTYLVGSDVDLVIVLPKHRTSKKLIITTIIIIIIIILFVLFIIFSLDLVVKHIFTDIRFLLSSSHYYSFFFFWFSV